MAIDPTILGAIIAAGITGVVSLLGLIISKEHKVSDFRQQWIDSLRDDISELLGYTEVAAQYVRAIQRDRGTDTEIYRLPSELFEKIKNEVRESERLYHKVLLRINPEEHSEVVDILEEIRVLFSVDGLPSGEVLHNIEVRLIKITQSILKNEWCRVKKGEPTFLLAKYIAAIVLIASVCTAGVWLVTNYK